MLLGFLFIRSVFDLADPDASYSGGSVLGLGVPLVIGGSFLLLGFVLMLDLALRRTRPSTSGAAASRPSRARSPPVQARPAEEL